jgi:predicted ATP-dependent endonuclease of OLD family
MAKELAQFINFAKLENTSVAFNDITVIAGKPGTGKSYVMKVMYALHEVFSLINNKSYLVHYALIDNKKPTLELLKAIFSIRFSNDKNINEFLEQGNFIELKRILDEEYIKSSEKNDGFFSNNQIKHLVDELASKQQEALSISEEDAAEFLLRNILQSIFGDLTQINDNFNFTFKDIEVVYSSEEFNVKNFYIASEISNAIFVETPLILEFEKYFPIERFKTPYHIDSLLNDLRKNDYSFISNEINDFIIKFKKASEKIIKGHISKSLNGFQYKSNNGKIYEAVNISSGTKSIGLLQYLVNSGVLKPGSVLFWEEPEVHLHPVWQMKMIELFLELMKEGVKIIFSTHSPYMCDYLNALTKKNGFEERVSFNLFIETTDHIVNNEIIEDNKKWKIIQGELLDPLEEIMWEYI